MFFQQLMKVLNTPPILTNRRGEPWAVFNPPGTSPPLTVSHPTDPPWPPVRSLPEAWSVIGGFLKGFLGRDLRKKNKKSSGGVNCSFFSPMLKTWKLGTLCSWNSCLFTGLYGNYWDTSSPEETISHRLLIFIQFCGLLITVATDPVWGYKSFLGVITYIHS